MRERASGRGGDNSYGRGSMTLDRFQLERPPFGASRRAPATTTPQCKGPSFRCPSWSSAFRWLFETAEAGTPARPPQRAAGSASAQPLLSFQPACPAAAPDLASRPAWLSFSARGLEFSVCARARTGGAPLSYAPGAQRGGPLQSPVGTRCAGAGEVCLPGKCKSGTHCYRNGSFRFFPRFVPGNRRTPF